MTYKPKAADKAFVILPCPFCGAPASIEELPGLQGIRFSVGCDSETEADCMGYQSLTTFNTRKEAVDAWNKRYTKPEYMSRADRLRQKVAEEKEQINDSQ